MGRPPSPPDHSPGRPGCRRCVGGLCSNGGGPGWGVLGRPPPPDARGTCVHRRPPGTSQRRSGRGSGWQLRQGAGRGGLGCRVWLTRSQMPEAATSREAASKQWQSWLCSRGVPAPQRYFQTQAARVLARRTPELSGAGVAPGWLPCVSWCSSGMRSSSSRPHGGGQLVVVVCPPRRRSPLPRGRSVSAQRLPPGWHAETRRAAPAAACQSCLGAAAAPPAGWW